MRVRHTVNVIISDDAEGKDVLFGLDEDKAKVVADGFDKYEAGKFEIAVSSNENLSFGDVADVRGIFVKAVGDFQIKLNGGSEVIDVKRSASTEGTTARFLGEFDITQINILNPSASAVLKGIYVVWGDPSA